MYSNLLRERTVPGLYHKASSSDLLACFKNIILDKEV